MLTEFRRTGYRVFASKAFTTIDWLSSGVVLAVVQPGSSGQVLRSEYFEFPHSHSSTAGVTAMWLQQCAQQIGASLDSVVVSISRRDVTLKLLALPNLPSEDLGALMNLQVESRYTSGGVHVVWDCLHHRSEPGDENRFVSLITVAAETCRQLTELLKSAGASHVVVTVADLLLPQLITEGSDGVQILIQANRIKQEVMLCRHGVPFASAASHIDAGVEPPPGRNPRLSYDSVPGSVSPEVLLATIHRIAAAIPGAWRCASTDPVDSAQIWICGLHRHDLAAALRGRLPKVRVIDADDRAARALAMARSFSQSSTRATHGRIDLLRPRNQDGARVRRWRKFLRITVAAVSAVIALVLCLHLRNAQLEHELEAIETDRASLQQYVERGQAAVNRWNWIRRWKTGSLNAADELRQMSALLPGRERMILTRLQLENPVELADRILRLDGLALSPEDISTLSQRILEDSEHYALQPQGIEPAPSGSVLPKQFRLETSLKISASLSATPESE